MTVRAIMKKMTKVFYYALTQFLNFLATCMTLLWSKSPCYTSLGAFSVFSSRWEATVRRFYSFSSSRTDTETPGNYKHAMPGRKATKKRGRWRKRKRKGMVLAEEVHSRQSRGVSGRQAVIRRLNSRSSRSVFVRVNLHQVSIFRAFRYEARRGEARRGDVMRTAWTPAASPLRRAKSTVTVAVINNTSKNNGENIGNGRPNVGTAKDNSTRHLTHTGKYFNDKFSYELAYGENEYQLARDSFIFQWRVLMISSVINDWLELSVYKISTKSCINCKRD